MSAKAASSQFVEVDLGVLKEAANRTFDAWWDESTPTIISTTQKVVGASIHGGSMAIASSAKAGVNYLVPCAAPFAGPCIDATSNKSAEYSVEKSKPKVDACVRRTVGAVKDVGHKSIGCSVDTFGSSCFRGKKG